MVFTFGSDSILLPLKSYLLFLILSPSFHFVTWFTWLSDKLLSNVSPTVEIFGNFLVFLAFLEYFFTFSATFISFRKKCARSGRLGVVCLSMRSALSRGTSFKMADNTVSDSDSRWKECADEGPINRIAEGWGQISLPPKKLK